MSEDQETSKLKEDAAEVARESQADMFLRKAREARAKAGIEEEYTPDETLNRKVDGYINETSTSLSDKLSDRQKEFLGTLIFTASEREGDEPWVTEGERRIDDKFLDEARIAGLLVIDEVEEKKLPSELKTLARKLRKNIGKMTNEEREKQMEEIEHWKNEEGRVPLELKKYEEWEQRQEMIRKYNERLRISEKMPGEVVEEESVVEEPSFKDRFTEGWYSFWYGLSEEEEEDVVEAKPQVESGLSRGLASLAESKDRLSWGNARLASQRAELAKRVEEDMKEEERAEVVEDETVEQAKERAAEEEDELSEEEQGVLDEGEVGEVAVLIAALEEVIKRSRAGDITDEDELVNEAGKALNIRERILKQTSKEAGVVEETGEAESRERKESDEEKVLREQTAKLLGEFGKNPKKVLKKMASLASGELSLEDFCNDLYERKWKDGKVRRRFLKEFRGYLKRYGYSEEELDKVGIKKLQKMFNKIAEDMLADEKVNEIKKGRKALFWMSFFELLWEELKQGVKQGVAE